MVGRSRKEDLHVNPIPPKLRLGRKLALFYPLSTFLFFSTIFFNQTFIQSSLFLPFLHIQRCFFYQSSPPLSFPTPFLSIKWTSMNNRCPPCAHRLTFVFKMKKKLHLCLQDDEEKRLWKSLRVSRELESAWERKQNVQRKVKFIGSKRSI